MCEPSGSREHGPDRCSLESRDMQPAGHQTPRQFFRQGARANHGILGALGADARGQADLQAGVEGPGWFQDLPKERLHA